MGSARRVGLADALFTPVQQRVLRLLFAQPNRRYQSAELIRREAACYDCLMGYYNQPDERDLRGGC